MEGKCREMLDITHNEHLRTDVLKIYRHISYFNDIYSMKKYESCKLILVKERNQFDLSMHMNKVNLLNK